MPLRGDEWRLQNGNLGAAMRLKALRHAPIEITGYAKTSRQLKNKQKPEQNNLDPHSHLPTCTGSAIPPPPQEEMYVGN